MSRGSVKTKTCTKSDASSLYALRRCLKTTYALTRDRNFDNFLYKIGVEKEVRRRAINLKPTIKLTRKKEDYTLTTTYDDGSVRRIAFEMDKPMVVKLANGSDVTCVFTAKNGKLEETLTTDGGLIKVTRKFTPDNVIVTMQTENERCERFYKKVPKPDSNDIGSETSRRTFASSVESDTTGETFATQSEIELRNIL